MQQPKSKKEERHANEQETHSAADNASAALAMGNLMPAQICKTPLWWKVNREREPAKVMSTRKNKSLDGKCGRARKTRALTSDSRKIDIWTGRTQITLGFALQKMWFHFGWCDVSWGWILAAFRTGERWNGNLIETSFTSFVTWSVKI